MLRGATPTLARVRGLRAFRPRAPATLPNDVTEPYDPRAFCIWDAVVSGRMGTCVLMKLTEAQLTKATEVAKASKDTTVDIVEVEGIQQAKGTIAVRGSIPEPTSGPPEVYPQTYRNREAVIT